MSLDTRNEMAAKGGNRRRGSIIGFMGKKKVDEPDRPLPPATLLLDFYDPMNRSNLVDSY